MGAASEDLDPSTLKMLPSSSLLSSFSSSDVPDPYPRAHLKFTIRLGYASSSWRLLNNLADPWLNPRSRLVRFDSCFEFSACDLASCHIAYAKLCVRVKLIHIGGRCSLFRACAAYRENTWPNPIRVTLPKIHWLRLSSARPKLLSRRVACCAYRGGLAE
jgi:hypothetical protein